MDLDHFAIPASLILRNPMLYYRPHLQQGHHIRSSTTAWDHRRWRKSKRSLAGDDGVCLYKRANDSANLCYLHRYMSPYYVIPIAVLVVQTLLLVLSWTFFAITFTKPVPLSVEYAIKFSRHVQSVTMVMTLLASSISLVSGVCVPNPFSCFDDVAKQSLESNSLYTRALRYALARFIATKVSLYAVFGAIKMANSSPIKNFTRPTWTIVSLLCVIAINAQTAGCVVP